MISGVVPPRNSHEFSRVVSSEEVVPTISQAAYRRTSSLAASISSARHRPRRLPVQPGATPYEGQFLEAHVHYDFCNGFLDLYFEPFDGFRVHMLVTNLTSRSLCNWSQMEQPVYVVCKNCSQLRFPLRLHLPQVLMALHARRRDSRVIERGGIKVFLVGVLHQIDSFFLEVSGVTCIFFRTVHMP
jgi:hypothetical protein